MVDHVNPALKSYPESPSLNVAVVKNPMKARPYRCLGRVMAVTPGDNDLIRLAKIRKPDAKVQEQLIKHLNPLELSITHSHQVVIPSNENSTSDILVPSHPKRSNKGLH